MEEGNITTTIAESNDESATGDESGLCSLLDPFIDSTHLRGDRSLMTRIGNVTVKDHLSLTNPSSTVTFGDREMLIILDNHEQITLEKKSGEDHIITKQANLSSPGLLFMRLAYTLVSLLLAGFLFVFCIQIVLFLFLGLAIESGLTSQKDLNPFTFIGTLLAVPFFISGLSQIMAIANTFVLDTWKGSKFMKTVTSWESTLVDWLSLFVFFGFPVFIASIALCTGTKYWWNITSISWFILILVYFFVFGIFVVYYEVTGCLELVKYHPKLREGRNPEADERSIETFYLAFLLRMKQRLSGYMNVMYTASGSDPHPDGLSYREVQNQDSFFRFTGIWGRLTQLKFMKNFYTVLDEPMRQYNVDEVLDSTPFVTRSSWSLESIYCRNRDTRFVAIIDGESAITREQASSSFYCFILGTALTLFAVVSLLVWFDAGVFPGTMIMLLYILAVFNTVRNSVRIKAAYKKILTDEGDSDLRINRQIRSTPIFQVEDTFRITEPTTSLCWIVFGIDLLFFFIVPTIALFTAKNNRVGIVFILMGFVCIIRKVFNAPACLQELGSLEGIEVNNDGTDGFSEWREKHRLGKIISEVSVGRRSNFWVGVFLVFVLAFCGIFISAVAQGSDAGSSKEMKFADQDEFLYNGSDALSYASCSLGHNIKSPHGTDNSLADFAFLSAIAYLDDNAATQANDEWFGDDVVDTLSDNVYEFKTNYQNKHGTSAVSYKLFDFANQDLKIVSVRGTSNNWDTLSDIQLWSSAALSQGIRAILPLGGFWTPILPYLVKAVSIIEDKALKDVSYYKETSAFVKSLIEKGFDVQITGHSLGGGLAMITGAQMEIPSIGLSGPNNMISRNTFDPPISIEALNKYTFNIVPDRDPVPRIDDLAQNYQPIDCRADPNKPVDCHSAKRSVCEILFTCGSSGRPVPCFCVNDYGYEEPASIHGKSFSDYCTDNDSLQMHFHNVNQLFQTLSK